MIYLELPCLPPSVNAAYTTIMKSKGRKAIPLRILTKEGRKFKEEAKAHLAQKYPLELGKFAKNVPYVVVCRLHITGLCTKGWPEKAKNRYKTLDATNRIKLLEDVLAEVTDVDDAQNLVFVIQKVDSSFEKTELWAWNMEQEPNPITDALFNL